MRNPTVSPPTSGNLLVDFYDRLPEVIAHCVPDPSPVADPVVFSPGFALPELDDAVRSYLAVATAQWQPVGEYRGHRITLLDLTGNPGTHTTKTYASLLIVARAVEHIRRTGRSVMIVSPTSANKGVALRDAVLRALDAGLAEPEQLRIVTLAPQTGRHKLRATRLSTDPALRALNPQLLYTGKEPEAVKSLARDYVREHAATLHRTRGLDVWFSLELSNYMVADAGRALFEQRVDPTDAADRPRVHAHAVSSAFGLLGYHAGRSLLESTGVASAATRPASLLVQHLATPDMVLSLRAAAGSAPSLPPYPLDPATGLFRQAGADPHFPAVTYDPDEVLDATFYTHRPVTSGAMNEIITRFGGDGIVVSLAECVARYPYLRTWLGAALPLLPADFRTLREWSTVMAFTGVTNAIDRGLVEPGRDVVVHGTGCYADGNLEPLCGDGLVEVADVADITAAVR
ncbi:hypothetical protein GCM10022251_38870 [Phytohabitans flavus]|uniref:Uncharacterized protein n=1 Tax=Phytohabitans flavus TaxID=1076124 RepID=A0A6F8XVE6_9ACTN|nr:DUF6002 family protein [Phytohabitans flavus]BCB77790.1 hypothetical protein Pflav_042000 [Phytohabitans flavus]